MTLKTIKLAVASVMALGFAVLSGCAGGPCNSACEKFNACPLDKRDHDVECNAFCSDEQRFEARAQAQNLDTCAKEFQAYIDCENGLSQDDTCNADVTTCDDSLTAYTDCAQKFCDAPNNGNDPACLDEGADDNGNEIFAPAFAGF